MKNFLQDFIAKKGIWVGLSLIISRGSNFLLTLIAARLLTESDFGFITFGLNYLTIFLAFSGFGAAQGVLKFGSGIQNQTDKNKLFDYAFSYGLLYNFILSFLMIVIAGILYYGEISKLYLILIFTVRFLGVYISEQKKVELRANFDNESFAKLDIFLSSISFVLGIILLWFFALNGFIASLCIAPFFVLIYDRKLKVNFKKINLENFTRKEFWRFSWTTALTTQIGELVFIIDIFFIGLLMSEKDVALYKVSSMIPVNILVLGFIFMQTEYPKLCKHHKDKIYQFKFILNYLKLFSTIGAIILGFGFLFDNQILAIFGEQYKDVHIYKILLIASVISLCFRVLFVYMLASIGKSFWNLSISTVMLVSTSLFLYFLVPSFGLDAVAYITFGSLTLSGILPAIAYFYESKRI